MNNPEMLPLQAIMGLLALLFVPGLGVVLYLLGGFYDGLRGDRRH